MKVLLCHSHYQQPGGERTAVESLVSLLSERNVQFIPFMQDNSSIADYALWGKVALVPSTIYSRKTYNQARDLIRREKPDVAHVHNVFPLLSPSLYRALSDAGVPIVQTVHNFRFLCPNGLFYTHDGICERCKSGNTLHAIKFRCYRESYLASALYATAIGLHRRAGTFDKIRTFVALAEFSARKLIESRLAPPQRVTVLGSFLREPLPEVGSLEAREPYVVYVGRLAAEKGLETLIDAMARLPRLGLKILGDGPLLSALKSRVENKQMKNVEFLGYIIGEQKMDILRRACASVIPSLCYENFPMALVESLAVGTPVTASNLGNLPFLIEDGRSGLLFRSGDSADLGAKLGSLIQNPQRALEMGAYGRRTVESKYTGSAHLTELMKIYSQAC